LFSSFAARSSAYEGAVRREEKEGAPPAQPVLTKAPELTKFVEATYPEEALSQGKTGEVQMNISLDAMGRVIDAQVVEPAGFGFDEAALDAVRQFEFTPAEVDGAPSAIQFQYVYRFTLEAAPKPEPPPPPKATLKGEVIARGSRTRIPSASVVCEREGRPEAEGTSDEKGQFGIEVSPGACEVKVVASGHQPFSTLESLVSGETLEVVYHLLPETIGYETVIRGQRDKKEVVRRTVSRAELQKIPGTFGDPIRSIQNLPGLARPPFSSGALIVRGAAPDQTLTFLDGVPVPLIFHLGGGPSVVNAEFLDRIDFYPGGFGARYGRALGGILDVRTRKGAADTLHGSAKVDVLDAGFFLESPVAENVSVAAAARRSYIDVLLPLFLSDDEDGGSLVVVPRYWDYQVRVDVGPQEAPAGGAPQNTFYAMAFGSDDILRLVATGGARNREVNLDVHTLFHRVKGNWTYRHGKVTSALSPFLGYDLGRITFGATRINSDIYTAGLREDVEIQWTPQLTLRAGLDFQFQHIYFNGEFPTLRNQYIGFPGAEPQAETQSLLRHVNAADLAGYLETDIKLGRFTVTPGLRASAGRTYGQNLSAVEPRLWLKYKLSPRTEAKASVGLYTQAPQPANFEPAPLGNPLLSYERAFQSSVGIERKITEDINLDVTAFFNRRYDLVVSPGVLVPGQIRPGFGNGGLSRDFGIEVLARHEVTRNFFGWLAYTWSRSFERETLDPTDEEYFYHRNRFDQTHILTLIGSYRFSGGYELGARFRYVTGRPRTALVYAGDQYRVDSNQYFRTAGGFLASRLPSFHQLDIRFEKSWAFQSWTLSAYLDVQNVYNAKNAEGFVFDYRQREETIVPGIPILPVIGVKGSF
jgi:TonB family protein